VNRSKKILKILQQRGYFVCLLHELPVLLYPGDLPGRCSRGELGLLGRWRHLPACRHVCLAYSSLKFDLRPFVLHDLSLPCFIHQFLFRRFDRLRVHTMLVAPLDPTPPTPGPNGTNATNVGASRVLFSGIHFPNVDGQPPGAAACPSACAGVIRLQSTFPRNCVAAFFNSLFSDA
jgi:hypothetical protein